jgi:hypothetical protein
MFCDLLNAKFCWNADFGKRGLFPKDVTEAKRSTGCVKHHHRQKITINQYDFANAFIIHDHRDLHVGTSSISPLVAFPVDEQSRVLNRGFLNLVIHAFHRVLQFDVPCPSTELRWNITGIDTQHSNVVFRCFELDPDRDAERVQRRLGYTVADVRTTVVVFTEVSKMLTNGNRSLLTSNGCPFRGDVDNLPEFALF